VIDEAAGTMEFPPLEDIDFEEILPEMPSEALAKLGILPRLSQPPQKLTTQEEQPESEQEEIIVEVVKVVAPVVPFLPQQERYRMVFMQRDIKEIVSSQNRMLDRLEKQGGDIEDKRLQEIFLQQAFSASRLRKRLPAKLPNF